MIMTTRRGSKAATMRHRVRRTALVLACMAAVTTLTGCGAGQEAQTSRMVPAIPGVDANAGPIALRDLFVPFREGGYPRGGEVPLEVRMFSASPQPVRLVAAVPQAGGSMSVTARRVVLRPHARGSDLLLAPYGRLELVPDAGPYLAAEDIAAPLPMGYGITVRFEFSTGNSVVVDIPMAPPPEPDRPGRDY